jgi:hypothetical protein
MGAVDLLSMMAIVSVALLVTLAVSRPWPEWQRRWTLAALAFHALCCLAQVAITKFVFGGGDIYNYFRCAHINAELILQDPQRYAPELLPMFTQQSSLLVGFSSGSTDSMVAFVTLTLFPAFLSFMGSCMLFGVLSFSGKMALFKSLEPFVHPVVRKRLFAACLFIPSLVFWSSAIMKESVAVFALGWIMWAGVSFWLGKRSPIVLLVGASSIWLLSMIKAYVVLTWAVAVGVWFVWSSLTRREQGVEALLKKPLYLILGAIGTIGLVFAIGEIAPRYSATSLLDEAAYLQEVGQQVKGGSHIQGTLDLSSSSGRIQAIPIALVTSLFRPFIFEVHNAVALINALETTGVLLLFVFVLARRGVLQTVKAVLRTPALMFCVTFTVVFAIGVGISTTNLGTMSRYRVPMLPFFLATLLLLYPVARSRATGPRA